MRIVVIAFLSLLMLSFETEAQDSIKTFDFYKAIKKYDLSTLWVSDTSFHSPNPLGFIGDSFQRFFIHFSSVKKDSRNPYLYLVKGKTMVKKNVCDFNGTILIKSAEIWFPIENECTSQKIDSQGAVQCEVSIYEARKEDFTGHIKGKLGSGFYIDSLAHLEYDDLDEGCTDTYSNNQFTGIWTSYKKHITKKCNWGDDRIPESEAFDFGAGEFEPGGENTDYNNGWDNYTKAYNADDLAIEMNWWK